MLISKGAVPNMLQVCSQVELADGSARGHLRPPERRSCSCRKTSARKGLRAIGVAYRDLGGDTEIDERAMRRT